jgi:hypothetical protein
MNNIRKYPWSDVNLLYNEYENRVEYIRVRHHRQMYPPQNADVQQTLTNLWHSELKAKDSSVVFVIDDSHLIEIIML